MILKKGLLVTLILVSLLTAIVYLFYRQEVQYWLPTAVPQDYENVSAGTIITSDLFRSNKRKFLHFYNPYCPCSRFNLATYRELIKDYHKDFECYAVVQESVVEDENELRAFFDKMNVKLLIDKDQSLARKTGVYSTPQIVLLEDDNKLYYRGNYNKTRYCTSPATNFGKIAMDSMLQQKFYFFPVSATTAYGCDLSKHSH